MDGVFKSGVIITENGKISEIKTPAADELNAYINFADIDARGLTVYPGFIDAHSHIGMIGSGVGIEGDDLNEESEPVTPHLRTIDALDPLDSAFADARKAGITCAVTGSGSANAIGGDMIAVKTVGTIADEMFLRKIGIKFALGENPKAVHGDKDSPPVTRMGVSALIREALFKAKRYKEDLEAAKSSEDLDPPEFDVKSEALLPLLDGTLAAHFHCHKANDIATAIRIADEFGLKYTLVHCTEGHLIADFLARKGATAIVGPIISSKNKPELQNFTEKNAAFLSSNGITVALCTDHPEVPEHFLYLSAQIAAENGLQNPIDAITSEAAAITGLDDRIGSIKPGLDADFVIVSRKVGFDVRKTIINGKIVYNADEE
jgi:imidazolonepropionase-like amidohydrolase